MRWRHEWGATPRQSGVRLQCFLQWQPWGWGIRGMAAAGGEGSAGERGSGGVTIVGLEEGRPGWVGGVCAGGGVPSEGGQGGGAVSGNRKKNTVSGSRKKNTVSGSRKKNTVSGNRKKNTG
eukprot:11563-Chlamydomonas_euryale.AAC.7